MFTSHDHLLVSERKFQSACQCVDPFLHGHVKGLKCCLLTFTYCVNPQCRMTSTLNSFRVESKPFRSVNERCHPINLGAAKLSCDVSCPAHFLISAINIAHENRADDI